MYDVTEAGLEQETAGILKEFQQTEPCAQVYLITGAKGSDRTAALAEITNGVSQLKDWIVVNLNPKSDMLKTLAEELSSRPDLGKVFMTEEINLSYLGLGADVAGELPITDVYVALDRMLSAITKHGMRVLVTVDDVLSTPRMREFTAQFQIFLRKNYNVFLVMAGEYENMDSLRNEKTLTFLYRVPGMDT